MMIDLDNGETMLYAFSMARHPHHSGQALDAARAALVSAALQLAAMPGLEAIAARAWELQADLDAARPDAAPKERRRD